MCCTRFTENTGGKKWPFRHHRTTLSGCIFATKACIDNRKENLLNSNTSSTCPHNMVMRSVGEFGAPSKFQRVSLLGSITARHSSSGRQPKFAALNRGRHLYSARRPSRWALAHIIVFKWNEFWRCFNWDTVYVLASCYCLVAGSWFDKFSRLIVMLTVIMTHFNVCRHVYVKIN